MIRFACPIFRKTYKAKLEQIGRQIVCKQCNAVVVVPEPAVREVHYGIPLPLVGAEVAAAEPTPPHTTPSPNSPPPPRERRREDAADEPIRWQRPPQKFCHACGGSVNKRASVCPDCGVRQFDPDDEDDEDDEDEYRRAERRRDDAIHSTRVTAAILGILLGGFGVHKFVLGNTGAGVAMLLTSLLSIPAAILLGAFTCGLGLILLPGAAVMSVIGLVEGVLYLTKSDREFRREYIHRRKAWF